MTEKHQDRRQFTTHLMAGATAAALGIRSLAGSFGTDRVEAAADNMRSGNDSGAHDGQTLPGYRLTAGQVSGDGRTFHEAVHTVPIVESQEVIICGGGPAGIAAALASARLGARTRLLEVHGGLGGVWTAGLLSLVIDLGNKQGIMHELRHDLENRRAAHLISSGSLVYDVEAMKRLLEEKLVKAGVAIQLHTRVVAAARDDRQLSVVLTESKSGRQAWRGKVFVDCTGDGDLAALAGCRFDLGRPENGTTQPMSLIALVAGPPIDRIAAFVRGEAEPRQLGNPKQNLLAELLRAGVDPSYHGPTIFCIRDGLYCFMCNHQYNALATEAADVTQATLEARQEVHRLVDGLRRLGGPWQNLRIVATAEQIGTREGRRIHGRYRVVAEDLARGARFDDAVCRVTFGIDVHSTNQQQSQEIEKKPFRSKPYDIPLRALIARDVDGLLMAGRCISGDFIAHSSYRVTGNAVAMGEAAGTAAAFAAAKNILPHECPFEEVAKRLAKIR